MLKIDNLTVSYDNKIALNNFSAHFAPSKISGLIGPNGAGKSTLLKTCVGIISNYSGKILFDEHQADKNRFWVKENCAYAPENAELLPYLSGFEYLKLIANIYNLSEKQQKIAFYMELLDLTAKKDELIYSYSHGMKQKLAVASVLLADTKFVFLDESLNGLDSIALTRLFEHLKQLRNKGKLVLITSHNVQLIQNWCDEVMIINKGVSVASYNKQDLEKFSQTNEGFLKKYMKIINE